VLKSINKIIKILIVSDFFFNYAWGLLGPVFAIFIVQNITVENMAEGAKVAGFASLVYWIVKSLFQIPIGRYLDKNHGEKDDFWFMVLGTFVTGIVPIGFLLSSQPWHIYGLQILHATAMAMLVPSWYAIFTRHIDKGKEAYEWGTWSTVLGFGVGIAGAMGGIMVATLGFKLVFIFVGVINTFSALLLLFIHKDISPKNHIFPRVPPFKTPF
jgi:MFS family permease